MSAEFSSESLCHSCDGLCCRQGMWIDLNPEEAQFMQEKGTRLVGALVKLFPNNFSDESPLEAYPKMFKRNRRTARRHIVKWLVDPTLHHTARVMTKRRPYTERVAYYMESDCGNLDTSVQPPVCTVYDDPNKPRVCMTFEAGGDHCLGLREQEYGPTPVEITLRTRTAEPPMDA